MDNPTETEKIEQPIETEEQKKLRADNCVKELDGVLEKYNCKYLVTHFTTSRGESIFQVLVETK